MQMQLHFLNREKSENSSFSVTHHLEPHFLKVWHYHPELELVLSIKSMGTRFVGDSIQKFEENDIVLIGKNLPHMWLNDDAYFNPNSTLVAEDITVHFSNDFLGDNFLETHELKPIADLLYKARYGIKFNGDNKKIIKTIKKLDKLKPGFKRTVKFMQVLHLLANHKQYEYLASQNYVHAFKKNQNDILDKTFEYIFENFAEAISLNDVAKVANMNPSAFSRFFKRVTRKPFSKYLNEVRVGYACKKLKENKDTIATICYESGYNNISNFNRQFKAIIKMSPREYVNKHKARMR